MSEELDLLKQENRQYANQLQTANEEKQSLIISLRLLANELRNTNLHDQVDTRLLAENTPYSKMAKNTLFFCLHVNWPLLPRFKPNIPLNSADGIEATRAN